jgi:hypothetical protein
MIAQINSSPVYADFNHGQKDGENAEYIQAINIITPNCCSEITGKVKVEFKASGMTYAKAYCWNSPLKKDFNRWGYDVNLTPKGIKLKKDGLGSFVIDTDKFPAGPMNIRIYAQNELGQKDYFELQLYNKNGVEWNQGIPDTIPNGAKGLNLIFSDDFDEELSISNDGRNARYNAHKPRFGDFSGWLFSNSDGEYSPFSQIDTYLKISARKPEGTKGNTGLIASVNMDGEGFWVKAPCYLECRLTAQSAPGTWPAFWTITDLDQGSPGDELDIVEAYGGVGQGNPNHPGYSVTSHFWSQNNPDGSKKKEYSKVIPIMEIGGKSYWSTTFHTYGLYIGMEETIYYFDDMEVFRHPTNDVSRNKPHCFLINYAIGGISGWPIDLERYGNGSDMYVDFVRVFATEKINYSLPRPQK